MLHLIGTGLYYLNDLPLRAVEVLKGSDEIFLERYTNLNDISFIETLEGLVNKKIKIIGREIVESRFLSEKSAEKDVVLLIPGDPLAATTHFSLIDECKERDIKVEIIHYSSIFSAVGETGLSLYKFGGTTSIPIYSQNFHPESFFDVIEKNEGCGYHTLVLLEVRNDEEFVSPHEAVAIIKKIEEKKGKNIIEWENVMALSKLGSESQKIVTMDYTGFALLKPPCALVIPGEINQNEREAIDAIKNSSGTL